MVEFNKPTGFAIISSISAVPVPGLIILGGLVVGRPAR